VPAVAKIAWRRRTFAVQALPNGSGMPRDLHMGDISREATRLGVFVDLHPHGRAVGVEEGLEVTPEPSRSRSPEIRRRRVRRRQ
jgi:hypothetical protein